MKTNKCECGFGYSGEWCQIPPVTSEAIEANIQIHSDAGNQSEALQVESPHLAPVTASWIQAATIGQPPPGNSGQPLMQVTNSAIPRTLQLAEQAMPAVTKRQEEEGEPHSVPTLAKLSPSPTLIEHEVVPSQLSALSAVLKLPPSPTLLEHEVMPTQLSALSPVLMGVAPPRQDVLQAAAMNTGVSAHAIVDNEDAAPQAPNAHAMNGPVLAGSASNTLVGLLSTAR
jgi:hypothetical protein